MTNEATQDLATKHTEIIDYTLALLAENGVTDWTVTISDKLSASTAAQANLLFNEITYSSIYVRGADEKLWQNTAKHEVAHVLTPGHLHDRVWKAKFVELGGDGKNHSIAPLLKVNVGEKRWIATCPNCGHQYGQDNAPRKAFACVRCCAGKFNADYIFTWTKDGVLKTPDIVGKSYAKDYVAAIR